MVSYADDRGSHELRSPLHGILASAELLQESSTGANQTELISMVDSCGRTLLDTMNHLLDYAKINNLAKQQGDGSNSAPGMNSRENLGLVTDLDLRALIEEVVEAMFTGYAYQNRMAPDALVRASGHDDTTHGRFATREKQDVVVFLDIDEEAVWTFSTEPGAWRRLISNILGNSLKYTSHGSIMVKLQADSAQNAAGATIVQLTVSDTGKGISKEYLKHKLYSPFSQEDSLAVGAGLGLSIVQHIVIALGGSVDIESEIGVGTTVTVSIPLQSSARSKEQTQAQIQMGLQSSHPFDGVTVCLLDMDDDSSDCEPEANDDASIYVASRKTVLRSILMKCLEGIKELNILSKSFDSIVRADIFITEEGDPADDLQDDLKLRHIRSHFKDASLILLRTRTSRSLPADDGVVRLSQPFGPRKLQKALQACLERIKTRTAPDLIHGLGAQIVPEGKAIAVKVADENSSNPPNLDGDQHLEPPTNDPKIIEPVPHILLVDDNDINRRIMCTFMRKLGCTFVSAADGLQALEAYRKESFSPSRIGKKAFDFVLMDINMPVMDGMTSTREIRAFEKDRKLSPAQVVALTGLANTNTRDEATASGMNMYLTKPVQLKVMKSVIGLG